MAEFESHLVVFLPNKLLSKPIKPDFSVDQLIYKNKYYVYLNTMESFMGEFALGWFFT